MRGTAWIVCLCLVFGASPCTGAGPGAPSGAFAYRACSPWEGPAVRVIVAYGPSPACDAPGVPSLGFSVNRALSGELSGLGFALDASAEAEAGRNGSAHFCADSERCRPVSGATVVFGEVDEETVSGTVEYPSEFGRAAVPFRATVCPSYGVCG